MIQGHHSMDLNNYDSFIQFIISFQVKTTQTFNIHITLYS